MGKQKRTSRKKLQAKRRKRLEQLDKLAEQAHRQIDAQRATPELVTGNLLSSTVKRRADDSIAKS